MDFTTLPFEYEGRYASEYADLGFSIEQGAWLEQRDRDLEDYLASLDTGGGKPYATYVVAASDSIAEGASRADYVCTGTDDHLTIQEAVDAVATGGVGGRILLLEGTYNVADQIAATSGVTIEGQGSNRDVSTPLTAPGEGSVLNVQAGFASTDSVLRLAGHGNTVSNLTIAGNGVDLAYGIFASTGTVIDNVFLHGIGNKSSGSGEGCGITLVGPHCVVTNTMVYYASGRGIWDQFGAAVITGNNIYFVGEDTSKADVERSAIFIDQVQTTVVSNNFIISGNGVYGIVFDSATQCTCTGNMIDNTPGAGIFVTDGAYGINITGNYIGCGGGHGIHLDFVSVCIVVGNQLEFFREGSGSVDIIHIGNASLDNYVAMNNMWSQNLTVTDARNGIRVDDVNSEYNVVVGNLILGTFSAAPITDNGTGTLLNWPNDATYGDNFT